MGGVASLTEQLSVLNTRETGSNEGQYNVSSTGDVISSNDEWTGGGGGEMKWCLFNDKNIV